MVGNLCTIFGFVCLSINYCLDLFICSDFSRLFGAIFPSIFTHVF